LKKIVPPELKLRVKPKIRILRMLLLIPRKLLLLKYRK